MTELTRRVSRQMFAGDDVTLFYEELDKLHELLDAAHLALDRQYYAAVIRELDFESLPDDRARASYVAGLLDGYEDRGRVKPPPRRSR